MSEVLCKDCTHSQTHWFNRLISNSYAFKCTLPENWRPPIWDPVVGTTDTGFFYGCHTARRDSKVCGPDARQWQPREKKHFLTYLKRI